MKLKLTGLLLTLLIPLGLSSPALAGHHEKEEASDPIAAAAEFPLLLRRTTVMIGPDRSWEPEPGPAPEGAGSIPLRETIGDDGRLDAIQDSVALRMEAEVAEPSAACVAP